MKQKLKEANKETRPSPKVGVYVCYCGGNISDHVDVEKVCADVSKVEGVVVARSNMFMCSDPGQEAIIEDIKSGKVDRVVVASCAPSLHEVTFRNALIRAGANPYIYEHANIREQVSWVHHGEDATDKATHLVAAAAAKARQLEELEPIRVSAKSHATIIGGGAAGLRAAKDLAGRGIEVMLIEKSPFLGGWVAQLDRLAPTGDKASELLQGLVKEVLSDPRITVTTCAEVVGFEGYVGNFKLQIECRPPRSDEDHAKIELLGRSGRGFGEFVPLAGVCPGRIPEMAEKFSIETGAVVIATGFKPYQPRQGEYGFGEIPEVVTLPDLIRNLAGSEAKGATLEYGGRPIRSLAMIHCVGSREIPGIHEEREDGSLNEYCSRTCCSAALNMANSIREQFPKTRVFDFYRDIRTYGRGQEELYERASHNKVLFFRFEPEDAPVVTRAESSAGYPVLVSVKDQLTFGEQVQVPVDLVVLVTGMEAGNIAELVDMMKLPVGSDRFLLEVHPKLRPVELSVAGIYLAGTCQSPMDMGEACTAAAGAAVKAASLLGRGYVELDPFVAAVDLDKCQGHGACVEACLADGALRLVDMRIGGEMVRRAEVNPALCMGCGACVAVCPENAIEVKGWTLKQYEAMVDMILADDVAA